MGGPLYLPPGFAVNLKLLYKIVGVKKKKEISRLTSCCNDEQQHIQVFASIRSVGQLSPPEEVLVRRRRCHTSLGVKEQLPEPGSPAPGCSLAPCSGFLEDESQRDITQLVFSDVLSLDSPPPPPMAMVSRN